MRWYLGYPVLALGLVIGGNTLFPGSRFEVGSAMESTGSGDVDRLGAARPDEEPADRLGHQRSRLAAFSPGAWLAKADPQPAGPTMFEFLAQAFASAGAQPAHAGHSPQPKPVAAKPWKSAVVHLAADTGAADTKPTPGAQRALLAREVQRELQRVGCYGGEIDGIWGPGSQRAVKAFMERVNAVLPVDEPDAFMLSLLSAEPAAVCGTRCPYGQALSQGDRCLPTTLLARNDATEPRLRHGPNPAVRATAEDGGVAQERALPDEAWQAVVAEARPAAPDGPSPFHARPFHGRMSLGAPQPEPIAVRPRFERTATLTQEADRVAVVGDERVFREDAVAVVTPPPLIESRPSPPKPRVTARKSPPKARAKKKWRSNYRHVQRLFEHPLGRM